MIRLLLIEDDPMVLSVNEGFVHKVEGFAVVGQARSAQEGLELVESLDPDLVLLDIFLPDRSGVEVLQEIRRRNLPCDVIMITASHDVDTIQQVLRFGAVDYIIKPFKFERLQAALEQYGEMRLQLAGRATIDQGALDRLRRQRVEERENLPKGLNEFTLKQIYLHLAKAETPLSAEELSEAIGLARVTARRYLDYMEKSGRIALDIQYGSVGRPLHKYYLRS